MVLLAALALWAHAAAPRPIVVKTAALAPAAPAVLPIRAPEAAAAVMKDFGRAWRTRAAFQPADHPDPAVRRLGETLRLVGEAAEAARAGAPAELSGIVDGMRHDVNNAITPGLLRAELVSTAKTEERRLDHAASVHKSAEQALATVRLYQGILKGARTGDAVAVPGEVHPLQLATRAADYAAPLAERKRIALDVQVDRGLVLEGDRNLLSVVLNNLLGNAAKYTPEGGRIALKIAAEPERPGLARVSVADTGIGIPESDLRKVFAGHRTEESRKHAEGTGQGLQLVKRFVESHGRQIELSSKPGEGSTFSFLLPILSQN